MSTLARVAREFADSFQRKTRDNGETFICLKDNAAEWTRALVMESHGDMLPDDWRYRFISGIAADIAERLDYDDSADLDDIQGDIVDGLIPVYNSERTDWLGSHSYRPEYCNSAIDEGLIDPKSGILDIIEAGIACELRDIYSTIAAGLVERAETLDSEQEESN